MNTYKRFSFITFAIIAALVFTGAVNAQSGQTINGDQFIIANTFRLNAGDTLNGSLFVIGGTANLESGSTVTGDVFLVGGTLTLAGNVNGSLIVIGSSGSVAASARIDGDLNAVGNGLRVANEAEIMGSSNTNTPFSFNTNETPSSDQSIVQTSILSDVLWAAFRVLALAALSMLIVLLFPKATHKVGLAITQQPFISFGIGLLTLVVAPFALVIMAITLILLPVIPLVVAAVLLAGLYGWMAIGYEIGDRIVNQEKLGWSEPVVAGFGTLLLGIVSAAIALIPCIGWVINVIIGIAGLGMVIITRLGTFPKETLTAPVVIDAIPQPESPQPPAANEPPAGIAG